MQERTILSGIDLKAYVGNLYKNPRFTEEMARLVTSDLESGLSKEETEEYSGGRYDYSQMCVYSKCIHKHYSPEEKKVILRDGLSGEQMALALEFYERGVPLATVAEITGNIGQTAYAMERRFQQVLEKAREAQETAETEQISRQDKAYMEGLVKQIQEAVAKISFQEEKYAALDKRFQELQTEKQDKEIRERLLAQLSEKDRTIEDQQNQINHAKTEVAKLKKELEDSRKEPVQLEEAETQQGKNPGDSRKKLPERQPARIEKAAEIPETISGKGYQTAVLDQNGDVVQLVPVEYTKRKERTSIMSHLFSRLFFHRKLDIVKLLTEKHLEPGQLVQIRNAIERGLTEKQLLVLVNSKISAEQMEEIISIAVYENNSMVQENSKW